MNILHVHVPFYEGMCKKLKLALNFATLEQLQSGIIMASVFVFITHVHVYMPFYECMFLIKPIFLNFCCIKNLIVKMWDRRKF